MKFYLGFWPQFYIFNTNKSLTCIEFEHKVKEVRWVIIEVVQEIYSETCVFRIGK